VGQRLGLLGRELETLGGSLGGTYGGGVFDITQVESSDGFESGDTSAWSNSVP
jgi:hypothetical protein